MNGRASLPIVENKLPAPRTQHPEQKKDDPVTEGRPQFQSSSIKRLVVLSDKLLRAQNKIFGIFQIRVGLNCEHAVEVRLPQGRK